MLMAGFKIETWLLEGEIGSVERSEIWTYALYSRI